jgi:trehalose utilization protein
MKTHAVVWNEYRQEKTQEDVQAVYPGGIHRAIADYLAKDPDLVVRTATLDEPHHGLTDEILEKTGVLIWWGHAFHHEVHDEIVEKIFDQVLRGMGLIVLHSAHFSKIFRKLMGTSCTFRWREAGEKERIWNLQPNHPIMQGIGEFFELEHEEMYGERFDIPTPDELVMISWFKGGEVFRSGCCFARGYGKVFYFQPGHETYPIYFDPNILRIIKNAVKWADPGNKATHIEAQNCGPLEKI